MPAIGSEGGKSHAGEKRSKRRKPRYTPQPTGSRGDSAPERKAPTPSGRHRTPGPPPPTTPPADVKSEQDLRRGDQHTRSKSYRGAIREAYDARSLKDRKRRVSEALSRPVSKRTLEDKVIIKTNRDRLARNKELRRSQALHDVVTNRDLAIARKYFPDLKDKKPSTKSVFNKVLEKNLSGTLGGVLKRPAAIVAAALDDPVGVPVKTGKGLLDTVKAVPAGLVDTVTNPEKIPEKALETGKQMADRMTEDFGETKKRVKKEGAAPDIIDYSVALPGASAAIAKITPYKPKPRPKQRVSGDVRREQSASRGVGGREVQRVVDKRRAARAEKQLQRAERDGTSIDPVVEAAARANRTAGDIVEVPMREGRRARAQRRNVATDRSRSVRLNKAETGRRVGRVAKAIRQLNKTEKKALSFVGRGIAPADRDGFLAFLSDRDKAVETARKADGTEPKGRLKRTDVRKDIEQLTVNVDKIDFTKLKAVVDEIRPEAIKVGREDPRLNAGQRLERRYAQQAETLGVLREPSEPTSKYIKRVQKAADDANLERPIYIPSERYDLDLEPDRAAFSVGGARATKRPFQYTGENFRLGLEDTTPTPLLTGMARNIKAKHNWKLVSDTFKKHTFDGLRNMSVSGLRAAMAERGISTKDVAFWNPGIYNSRVAAKMDADPDAHATELAETRHGEDAEFNATRIHDAVTDSAMDLNRAATHEYANMKGWSVVPKAAFDEISAATKPSGFLGRTLDIGKQKSSRYILGAANIPWLQFQVASNVALAGAATKLALPFDLARAQLMMRQLSPEEREAVNAMLGSGSFSDALQKTHIGAAEPPTRVLKAIVNSYRALKATDLAQKVGKANPLDAMFALDRGQNDVFRRTVLYNSARKEAFARMNENAGVIDRLQNRLTNIMRLDPDDQVKAIMRDPDLLEKHAEHVNDFLGDYTTFTHRERQFLQRWVMFYGFMRFSLTFTFYTMPVKHPLMSGIIAEIGQLEAEEIKKLFGGVDMPFSLGKFYFTDDGQLKSVDLAKMNPALNAAVSLRHPAQALTILPPYFGWLGEQMFNMNLWTGKDWKVKGRAAPHAANFRDYEWQERGRIALDDLLSLAYPYRAGEKLTQEGSQGDDSLLWDERRVKYKGKRKVDKLIKRSIQADAEFEAQDEDRFIHEIMPLLPRPDRDPEKAKENKAIDKAAEKKGKKKAGPRPFGASGPTTRPTKRKKGPYGVSR